MRLGQIRVGGEEHVVAVDDSGRRALEFDGTMLELIRSGIDPHTVRSLEEPRIATDAPLSPPLRPGKIVAIGLNYLDHIRETGLDPPTSPLVFAKFPSTVIGPGEPIIFSPEQTARVDWEVELGVIVGRPMRAMPVTQALDSVFGVTAANDVSARDLQFGDGQWTRGKNLDTFCPLGPMIVTLDEIGDPQDLALATRVNGELVQSSRTSEMIFDIGELLSYCSRYFALEPGDLLLTGTPWGCGEFMEPRRSLLPGDVVEVEVERIGVLRNPVACPPASSAPRDVLC
ncbi:MAG: fumarylacetoacetate hydrolase family protein [Solirubrobacteraceae bacterium]